VDIPKTTGAMVLAALVFLILVRHGFKGHLA
jgi:hypothetical protein